MNTLSLKLFYFIIGITITVQYKKYDIEREARKIYGTNVTTVLKNFRKSYDYVKILKDKASELKNELLDISLQTISFYQRKMSEEIQETMGIQNLSMFAAELVNITTTKAPEESTTKKIDEDNEVEPNAESDLVTEKLSKIDRIDKYSKLSSYLTIKERIAFRDLGFSFIGDCIHSIIDSLNGAGKSEKYLPMTIYDQKNTQPQDKITTEAVTSTQTKV